MTSVVIPLTRGKVALIDSDDQELVSHYKWHAIQTWNGNWYAQANDTSILMHRLIRSDCLAVDHKNGDGLDNRRDNLRCATKSQNAANQKTKEGRFKGICWNKVAKKWQAQVTKDYYQYYLGLYDTEEDAARAYDEKARELFGDYARVNFR